MKARGLRTRQTEKSRLKVEENQPQKDSENQKSKKPRNLRGFLGSDSCFSATAALLAERTGLEPATPGVTGRYSNQLNYRSS